MIPIRVLKTIVKMNRPFLYAPTRRMSTKKKMFRRLKNVKTFVRMISGTVRPVFLPGTRFTFPSDIRLFTSS